MRFRRRPPPYRTINGRTVNIINDVLTESAEGGVILRVSTVHGWVSIHLNDEQIASIKRQLDEVTA